MRKTLLLLCVLLLIGTAALAGETLTILRLHEDPRPMDEARRQAAQAELQKGYPNLEVLARQGLAADAEAFRGAQGDIQLQSADLYSLIAPDLERLISADALLCLSQEEALAPLLASLPDYGALWGKEGKVYSLPTRLHILLAEPGKEKELAALNLTPGNWTWEQVFAAVPLLREKNEKEGTQSRLLAEHQPLPLCLKQFFWQETLLPSPQAQRENALNTLLHGYNALLDADLLAKEGESALIALGYTGYEPYLDMRWTLPPALVSGGKSALLSAEMLVVPREAPNKQAALAYLSALFSQEAVGASPSYWNHGVFPADAQPQAEVSAPNSLALWQQAVVQSYPDTPLPQVFTLQETWRQYREGALSLEDCAAGVLALLPPAADK